MEETTLHAKLVLDDAASATADHIKKGIEGAAHEAEHGSKALEGLKEHVSETAHTVTGFGRDVAAAFLGFQLGGAVESMKELTHEFFGASAAATEQTKSMAGVLTVMGEAEGTFEQTRRAAGELRGRLDEMATAGGVDIAQVVEGFDDMALRSSKSADQVEDLTEKMIYAGRAVPGGFNGIAEGFRAMETGVIRANNPIVNLIKQTGNLDGSAKQIAKTLSAMAQKGDLDKVMELGSQAIEKVGSRMKDVQPSFAEMQASMRNIREQIFEEGGAPILGSLLPILANLRDYLTENKATIGAYAETLGTKVGHWVTESAHLISEGFEFIQSHADEIEAAIKEGFGYAKEVMEFILAHQELLKAVALGYVGGKALGAIAPGAGAIGSAISAAGGAGGAAKFLGDAGKMVFGVGSAAGGAAGASTAFGGALASVGGLGAAAITAGAAIAAIGGVAAAGYEAVGLYNDVVKEGTDDMDAVSKAARKMASEEENAYQNLQYFSDKTTEGARKTSTAFAWVTDRVSDLGAMLGVSEEHLRTLSNISKSSEESLAEVGEAAYLAAADIRGLGDVAGRAAKEIGEKAGVDLTAMLTQSARDHLAAGLDLGKAKRDLNLNMSGTKIEIKQEFRDMDPDRVAIAFERKMGRAVVDRISSSVSTPFT